MTRLLLLFLLFLQFALCFNAIWPLSGNSTPDLPQSSPFGPRLKASEAFRYDFHRGLDLPVILIELQDHICKFITIVCSDQWVRMHMPSKMVQ